MAQDYSSLPQVLQMDWTEDAELHKRYTDWRNKVQLILETYLLNVKNTKIKVKYVTLWEGKEACAYLKHSRSAPKE